ncbi:hypothetical protein DRO48_02250 [Candidatus Bathyarchaeota archaeon]|nr:MAG: hypothetical protein DRO48_02250 [Candidatus Bathyarchaeota archaeon]
MDEREASTVVMAKNTGRSGLAVEKLRQILSEDSSIWRCSICFTCLDVCPRDAEFTEFMIALRNLAALQGIVPTVYREQGSAILETGLAFKIPESRVKMRERYGLPPLPRVDAEPVRRLLESVDFDKLIQRGEKK